MRMKIKIHMKILENIRYIKVCALFYVCVKISINKYPVMSSRIMVVVQFFVPY